MFNEYDLAVLDTVLDLLHAQDPNRPACDIEVDDLIAALDAAGVCGLIHDGTRVIREPNRTTDGC
jgi:hypothetical protein